MTASAITFSVQMGSDGHSIARAVAGELKYRYFDREVISQAADLAGVSPEAVANAERWPSFLERMMETLGRASALSDTMPGSTVAAAPALLTMTSADYRGLIEQVVKELAARGDCVIVGHAGQAILRDQKSGIYKVLVRGSAERRAERAAKERSIPVEEALEAVNVADNQRIDFFKHVYDVEWLDSALYDLTISTDEVDFDNNVALVLTGAGAVA